MCPEGLIAQNTLKYYNISITGLTKAYTEQSASLKAQKDKAIIDGETYIEQLQMLAVQYKTVKEKLEEMAERFAREKRHRT